MKRKLKPNQIKEIVIVTILIFTTALSSVFAGYYYAKHHRAEIDDLTRSEAIDDFIREYNRIMDNYYLELDEDVLIKGAIKGMLEALEDKHSSYLDEQQNYRFQQRVRGQYEGIGIGLYDNDEGEIVISSVFRNTPAERAGIQIDDILIGVDDKDLRDKDTQFLVDYIRNAGKDYVMITLLRNGEEKSLKVEIETVILESVESRIIKEGDIKIGFVAISIFAANTTGQLEEHLQKLEAENIDGLIIDLRFNTGGYLSTAERIISMFFDKSHVIYQTEEKGEIQKFYSRTDEKKDYPIVLLGNSVSASASEIMIAALQEEYGAKFVGTNTYGKGTVQEMIHLDDDESLKYTARKWLTPHGNWIDEIGVTPDYEVEQSTDYFLTLDDADDAQLQKAIKVFLQLLKE